MPRLGLGVYQAAPGAETRRAVRWALAAGCRLIDTAARYGNEADVGQALRESGVPRAEVFVTTKLRNRDQGYDKALAAFDLSLRRLRLDCVDLYLLHWPVPGLRLRSWKALERIHREGRARAIGVCNFTRRHLAELAACAQVPPAVDQVEFSPFLYQKGLLAYCRGRGIQLEAYSPLTRGRRLGHPALAEIARRRGRSPAQVLLRWALEHGVVAIPKSVRRSRIRENARVFDFSLSPADMAALDGLDEGLRTGADPAEEP